MEISRPKFVHIQMEKYNDYDQLFHYQSQLKSHLIVNQHIFVRRLYYLLASKVRATHLFAWSALFTDFILHFIKLVEL